MKIKAIGRSSEGSYRDNNEDSFLIDNARSIYAVADGAGGGPGGEVASATAISALESFFAENEQELKELPDDTQTLQALRALARDAVGHAAARVKEIGSDGSPKAAASSLTLVLARGQQIVLGHVGDCRLYLYRDGKVHQLTDDHTIPAELARQGVIRVKNVATHPFARVLSRYLGSQESVIVDTFTFTALPGDRLLLCTNGAVPAVSDRVRLAKAFEEKSAAEIIDWLIAESRGSGRGDDCTVLELTLDFNEAPEATLLELDSRVKAPLSVLRSVPLFEKLSFARKARILNCSDILHYEDGEVLIEEGERCAKLIIVLSGQVKLNAAGYDLKMFSAGSCLGESFLFEPREARASLQTVGDTQILEIDRERLLNLFARRPRLGNIVWRNLGRSLALRVNKLSGEDSENDPDL